MSEQELSRDEHIVLAVASLKASRRRLSSLIKFLENYGDTIGEKCVTDTLKSIAFELRGVSKKVSPVLKESDRLILKRIEADSKWISEMGKAMTNPQFRQLGGQ